MSDTIRALDGRSLGKETAVTLFGNEEQKAHFEKYGKFKGKNVENSLIATMQQFFEVVEIDKSTRPNKYKLEKVREEAVKRMDKRENNSGKELPHTKYLDAVIIMAIKNRMFKHETTLNNWVLNFGLVSEALHFIKVNGMESERALEMRKSMADKGVIGSEKSVAELSFYLEDFDSVKNQVRNALEKMDKAGLIQYYKVPKVKLGTPLRKISDGKVYETEYVTIDSDTQEKITKKIEELKEKHGITNYEAHFANRNRIEKKRKEVVEKYYEELTEFYNDDMSYINEFKERVPIEVEYFWFNHAITAKATENQIKAYLKSKRPEFYQDFLSDETGFFGNVINNYDKEKKIDILRKAWNRAHKNYREIVRNHERDIEEKKAFGEMMPDDRRKLSYWGSDFCESVEKIYPYVKPTYQQKKL